MLDQQLKVLKTLSLTDDIKTQISNLEKRISIVNGERYIVKLLLNGLYGYFARSPDNLEARLVNNEGFESILNKHPILDEFDINDDISMVLFNPRVINNSLIQIPGAPVLSNVAIAAAITAYSRMIMNPFKIDPMNPCFYSDTDSLFLQYPLPSQFLGKELGLFKDELKGESISDAIFIKPKCYGYTTDSKTVVVIAGFPQGNIPFNALKPVLDGGTYQVTSKILVKDIKTLTLKSASITRTLSLK